MWDMHLGLMARDQIQTEFRPFWICQFHKTKQAYKELWVWWIICISSSRIWLSAINHFVSWRKNQWSGTGWKHRWKHTKRLSPVSLKHLFSRIWCEWRCHCICWYRGSWCLFTARKPTSRLCVKITKQCRAKLCSNRQINVSYHVFGISKFHQHFYGKTVMGRKWPKTPREFSQETAVYGTAAHSANDASCTIVWTDSQVQTGWPIAHCRYP